jgi:hypothetical protein
MTKDEIDTIIETRLDSRRIELLNQRFTLQQHPLAPEAMRISLDTYHLGMMDLRDALLTECGAEFKSYSALIATCELPKGHNGCHRAVENAYEWPVA